MPQDIPLEAGEKLVFVPECLRSLKVSPSFVLRTATPREKRFMQRIIREEGAVRHSTEAMRAEMLRALKPLWGEEAYHQHVPILEAYWQTLDEFELQRADDPDLEWTYDEAIETSVRQLENDVAQSRLSTLGRMKADNAFAGEVSMLALAAVSIVSWSGLKCIPEIDRGYLAIDAISEVRDELNKFEAQAGVQHGLAWAQLFAACTNRMFLEEDEEKNSESPSPSKPPPQNSKTGGAESGKSPASAPTTETPENS